MATESTKFEYPHFLSRRNVQLIDILEMICSFTLCINMNLLILLLFGILSTVYGFVKIPEYDACVLRVLLCDDFTKPLTPIDNSTSEMFQTIGELNAVCDELSKFRACLKNAKTFCEEHSKLDVGFQLLRNRRLAFDLCEGGSSHQHVYMMVEGCVNKYSHSAIQFCSNKSVETVGLDFDLGDIKSECRFLFGMQHCHIAIITDQCGSIAGNALEKLVVFRGERDFMCIEYEKERLKDIDAFYATLDSYVQQYRGIVERIETEGEAEEVDGLKKEFESVKEEFTQDQASKKFQSRISPLSDEDGASDDICPIKPEPLLNSETFQCNEKQSLCANLLDKEIRDSTTIRPPVRSRHFYEKKPNKVLSDENYACKTKASFLLTGIRPNGELYELGCGQADVLWATSSPLKDISCAWMVNSAAPMPLAKCSILIDHSEMARDACQRKVDCDLPFNATIAVYETVSEREAKRVAELRVRSYLKRSSDNEIILDSVKSSFKEQAYDIRYWCSEQYDFDLYPTPNPIYSVSRVGSLQSDVNEYSKINRQGRDIEEKYNFYSPEGEEFLIDTEINLLSSGDGDFEKEAEESHLPRSKDENLNPILSDEVLNEKNLDTSFTLRPSVPSKSSHRSYRPYELFRPRLGESLEVMDQDMSSKDLEIEDEESIPDSFALSCKGDIQETSTNHPYAEEMCPLLPENVSKVSKPDIYSKEKYSKMVDPLDIVEVNCPKRHQISKEQEDFSFSNAIWNVEESENINGKNPQILYEEIYVVTPSTVIELSSNHKWMVDGDAIAQNGDGDSEISNTEGDSQDFVEVSLENSARDSKLENDFIAKSTNPFEKEEMLPNSEIKFSKRSNQEYTDEVDEKFINTFEVLAKVKIDMMRIIRTLKETRMLKNSKTTSLRDEEL